MIESGVLWPTLIISSLSTITNNHGHAVGDEILKNVEDVLMHHPRTEDCVCRYVGEEFCVLLTHSDLDQTVGVAEKYRETIEALQLGGLGVTISLGVTSRELGAADSGEMNAQSG